MSRSIMSAIAVSSCVFVVLSGGLASAPSYGQEAAPGGQDTLLQAVLPLDETVLSTILDAPYSELFSVDLADGETGYGVKDRDYDPTSDDVGFYSLWGNIPDQGILQVAIFYCFQNAALAESELTEIVLSEGDNTLMILSDPIVATLAQTAEIVSERFEPSVYDDPFSNPVGGSFDTGGGAAGGDYIYLPAVDCSVGGGRFDLLPVQAAIAQLPSQTLDVMLRFSNGLEENWQLGARTVEQIKQLPMLHTQ